MILPPHELPTITDFTFTHKGKWQITGNLCPPEIDFKIIWEDIHLIVIALFVQKWSKECHFNKTAAWSHLFSFRGQLTWYQWLVLVIGAPVAVKLVSLLISLVREKRTCESCAYSLGTCENFRFATNRSPPLQLRIHFGHTRWLPQPFGRFTGSFDLLISNPSRVMAC